MRAARLRLNDQPRASAHYPRTGRIGFQADHRPGTARYVQYINTTYRRTGTLWDSRYKSSLIQAETYLLSCQRYIELNPVRAAMVDDPAHYRWTSYRHNGLGQANPSLIPHPLYPPWARMTKKGRLPTGDSAPAAGYRGRRSLSGGSKRACENA